ncbi:hypothetical protein J6590_006788 [Homalodisca vitripennis]|nr:hypothetical protein J6590_006788 [Homalodisca vitripennis]
MNNEEDVRGRWSLRMDRALMRSDPLRGINRVKEVPSRGLKEQFSGSGKRQNRGARNMKAGRQIWILQQHFPSECVIMNSQNFPKNRPIVFPGEADRLTFVCIDLDPPTYPFDAAWKGRMNSRNEGHEEAIVCVENSGDHWRERHIIPQKEDRPKNRSLWHTRSD